MTRTAWFDGPLPRIIAHRGLATHAAQNGAAAFLAALEAGATHLETDARATADGHAVLAHDATLAGTSKIARLSLAELTDQHPDVVTLAFALEAFPHSCFNLDVKSADAVRPVTQALAGQEDRVLVASFSDRRRLTTARGLGRPVATSASGKGVVQLLAGVRSRQPWLVSAALRGLDAVQLPDRALRRTGTATGLIAACHAQGVEVHVWTVNDPRRMRELVALGADGIITDRCDLAATALRDHRP